MYCFTNKEYERLCDAILYGDKTEQIFCLQLAEMKKDKENEKTRKRVNKKRKTNKYYGRPKPKEA